MRDSHRNSTVNRITNTARLLFEGSKNYSQQQEELLKDSIIHVTFYAFTPAQLAALDNSQENAVAEIIYKTVEESLLSDPHTKPAEKKLNFQNKLREKVNNYANGIEAVENKFSLNNGKPHSGFRNDQIVVKAVYDVIEESRKRTEAALYRDGTLPMNATFRYGDRLHSRLYDAIDDSCSPHDKKLRDDNMMVAWSEDLQAALPNVLKQVVLENLLSKENPPVKARAEEDRKHSSRIGIGVGVALLPPMGIPWGVKTAYNLYKDYQSNKHVPVYATGSEKNKLDFRDKLEKSVESCIQEIVAVRKASQPEKGRSSHSEQKRTPNIQTTDRTPTLRQGSPGEARIKRNGQEGVLNERSEHSSSSKFRDQVTNARLQSPGHGKGG